MVRIWGRVFKQGKVIKHATIDVDEKTCTFFDMLRTISEKLDVPTPVLLEKHVNDFNLFNMCVFKPDDFIQPVNFSQFNIQNLNIE